LAEVLTGKVPRREAIRSTRIKRLDVLAGRADCADGPSDTPTARWTRTLREFRQEYQFVLVDASPADDAMVSRIAPWADAAYLVIRSGRTGRSAARRAVHVLQRNGARLLGCVVLNDRARF
jgi:Mrp family chromosome partitioning ATPase